MDGSDRTTADRLPCDQPHRAQYFGHTEVRSPGPSSEGLTASCAAFISRETQIEKVQTIADLEVSVVAHLQDAMTVTPAVLPLAPNQSAYGMCALVSKNRLLGADPIATGDDPLPWVD